MNEKDYMLWLSLITNITIKHKLFLLNLFGSATDIYKANESDFHNKGIYNSRIIKNILSSKNINDVLSYKSLVISKGISIVHIGEEEYPYLLKNIFDPPIVLYYKGRLPKRDEELVSIVGTRDMSSYGETITYKASSNLAKENIGVVSGLALGVDTVAHKGALDHNGYTIAVVANGLDICYPSSNSNLMNKIAEDGLVLSEYKLGTRAMPFNFPQRNRIIAGLSKATIVTEAPIRSGSLITAQIALNEGRDILTFPADIFRKTTMGNNELLKDGAIPITSFDDILSAINFERLTTDKKIEQIEDIKQINDNKIDLSGLTEDEKELMNFFDGGEVDAEILSIKSNFKIEKVLYLLTMLEFKDIIIKLPTQKFMKNS